jgi:hypothetical protein
MILGLSTHAFTQLHVITSLIALATGAFATVGLLSGKLISGWTGLFLATTIATSVTGFFFHSKFGPAHVVGIISLGALAVALIALYSRKLTGRWRAAYVVAALFSFYLNAFVAVTQTFQKVAFFNELAPTQTEPPFKIAQGIFLLLFVAIGVLALKRFRPSNRTFITA